MKKSYKDWECTDDQFGQSSWTAMLIDMFVCGGLILAQQKWLYLVDGIIFVLIIPTFILSFFLIKYLILRFYYYYKDNK